MFTEKDFFEQTTLLSVHVCFVLVILFVLPFLIADQFMEFDENDSGDIGIGFCLDT